MAFFVFYKKPREYQNTFLEENVLKHLDNPKMQKQDYGVLFGAIVAFVVQIVEGSLPLGGLAGLLVMIGFGAIKWSRVDIVMVDGFKWM